MRRRLIRGVYDLSATLLLPAALIHHLYRSRRRGRPAELVRRFHLDSFPGGSERSILIHAVSVGEVMAARPLLKALAGEFPEIPLVMTTGTETGQEIARGLPEPAAVTYFPFLDVGAVVRRMYDRLSPRLLIVMETELWPNLIFEAHRRNVPAMIANGRISDRSFPRYRRLAPVLSPFLSLVDRFLMQSEADRERIVAAGAPPERVEVAGNLKYDIPLHDPSAAVKEEIRRRWNLPPEAPLLLFASTHRGEEEQIVEALSRLEGGGDFRAVIVPRHPERGGEAAEVVRSAGFTPLLHSEGGATAPLRRGEVLIVDRIGVLMELYAVATVAFVGGSLIPHGGHNLLEPASFGVPVLHGRHLHNFREMAALFAERRGSVTVSGPESLAAAIEELLADPIRAAGVAERGRSIVAENGGATERHLAVIRKLLERVPA